MKTSSKHYLYIFTAGSLWGTIGLFVKFLERYGSSASYTSFLRMFIGFILLAIITLAKDGPTAFKVSRNTLISCILLGLICQGVYNIAYSTSVNTIGVALSAVLLYTAPIFTSIISLFIFKEHLSKSKCLALFINIIGCVMTVTGGNFSGLSLSSSGLLFGITAGFCYSLSAIFGRFATDDASPFAVATYNFLFASLFLSIFLHPWTTVADPLNPRLLITGTAFALIPTAFGYIFYFKGLQGITESSKVPVVASIETVIATFIGIFVFHENLNFGNVLGILLVLSSIAVMNLCKPRPKH